MKKIFLRSLALLLVLFSFTICNAQELIQQVEPNRENAVDQQAKPYVVYISVDGLRWDLIDRFNAQHLKALRATGVQADYMKPSFPTLTFPNHYTLVTGMYPSHHGLVNNSFYDPQKKQVYNKRYKNSVQDSTWYNGIPIWSLAEKNHMLSASFYWTGSESAIAGYRPTYWYRYNEKISMDDRLKAFAEWLALPEDKRPHLITWYFPQVDYAGHHFGPESKESREAVQLIDEAIGKMAEIGKKSGLPINFILVSDHGMTAVDTLNAIPIPAAIDTAKFIMPLDDGVLLHLYAKDKKDVEPTYQKLKKEAKNFDVYLASNTPEKWHFSNKEDKSGRIGDIILVPHYPQVFDIGKKITIGKHGYDNDLPQMRATFYAWGPAFKEGIKIPPFENVNVYPLIAKILGLPYQHQIDGNIRVLQDVLK